MPYDGVDITTVNRVRLIEALRDIPVNFRWNFETWHAPSQCGTVGCAVGLAKEIGLIKDVDDFKEFASTLGLNIYLARDIFNPYTHGNSIATIICSGPYVGHYYRDVSPAMVAAALEATL
jgi:hypothetical protein